MRNLCSLHCQAVGSALFGARLDVGEAEGLQGEHSHSWLRTTCSVQQHCQPSLL